MIPSSAFLTIPVAMMFIGFSLIIWSARRLLTKSKKTPLHVQLYERVAEIKRSGEDAEVPEEAEVCYGAYRLYLYLLDDGLDKGIGNMEPENVLAALPALYPLGLQEAAQKIEGFVAIYEDIEQLSDVDENLGEDYQRTATELDRRLYPLLREIPERLERYLEK
ncbi:hypothetical protein [Celeribacter litoreus]|uniref:hypothetical protein n=1 Tax=Celeribacter litoreus TaxID=2876714 RepID=UPI001CCC2F7B|nr:hypothetical protein [Celeribacter litoreus]MCA0042425.1 hypothetical protein [Celeribacter litoreus]